MAANLVLVLALVPLSSSAILGRNGAFLGNGMQPEIVARTLSNVQDEWKAQAAVFAECNSTAGLPGATIVNCQDAPASFGKSCDIVVSAIIQGSGGDKDVAKEYMDDVCSQKSISGWHQTQCQSLAVAIRGSMSADKYANRMSFSSNTLCTSFWSKFIQEEKQRMDKEAAERDAAEKKAAEEAAEQEKQFEEARKKQAERKRVEEAEHAKEEAEAKAQEAAARVAQKKAEAEAVKQAAEKKMKEAEDAERESKKAAAKQAAVSKPAEQKPVEAKAEAKPAEAPPAPVAQKPDVVQTKAETKPADVPPAPAAPKSDAVPAKEPAEKAASTKPSSDKPEPVTKTVATEAKK